MDTANLTQLPTTVIGLVGFMAVGQIALVSIFLRYIQKKNGNLERVAKVFTDSLDRQQAAFERMLLENRK